MILHIPVILARKYSTFRKIACALTRPFEYNRDVPHERANVESSFCMHGINRAACFEFARFCHEQRKFPPTPTGNGSTIFNSFTMLSVSRILSGYFRLSISNPSRISRNDTGGFVMDLRF